MSQPTEVPVKVEDLQILKEWREAMLRRFQRANNSDIPAPHSPMGTIDRLITAIPEEEQVDKHLKAVIRKAAERAAPVFEAEGWTWARSYPASPGVYEIERTLCDLVRAVESGETNETQLGRLIVSKDEEGAISIALELGWWLD